MTLPNFQSKTIHGEIQKSKHIHLTGEETINAETTLIEVKKKRPNRRV